MDAIRNPDKERPIGECVIGEASRQYVLSLFTTIWIDTVYPQSDSGSYHPSVHSEGARRRFIEGLDKFTTSVEQARDRARNYVRNIDEYFLIRRESIGARPSFAVLEFRLNLPDEVFENPVVQKLTNICIDLIILSNVSLPLSPFYI